MACLIASQRWRSPCSARSAEMSHIDSWCARARGGGGEGGSARVRESEGDRERARVGGIERERDEGER